MVLRPISRRIIPTTNSRGFWVRPARRRPAQQRELNGKNSRPSRRLPPAGGSAIQIARVTGSRRAAADGRAAAERHRAGKWRQHQQQSREDFEKLASREQEKLSDVAGIDENHVKRWMLSEAAQDPQLRPLGRRNTINPLAL